MKVSSLVWFSTFAFVAGNELDCVTELVDGKDYFPSKAVPEESQFWSVTYANTYKVVSNTAAGETYLLYQCGTEPPADELDGRHAAVLSVPLNEAALLYTTMIPFLEILGARDKIAAFLGSSSWVSSRCVSQLLDEGKIQEVMDPYNATNIDNIPLDTPCFVGTTDATAFETQIRVSAQEEEQNLAAFEWVKYYSLFFNLEETATELFDVTKQRYSCAEENAALLSCDENEKKPVVLWASYSTYCGGWDVGSCPNYYCEFAESCQAELLYSESQGSLYSELCYRNYMTTEEFVAFGKDADIWIYTSPDFDTMLADHAADLVDFVSIEKQEVYDTLGSGDAWFEQRLAEPDVVLQDFCNIVGRESITLNTPHQRTWFRNVFTEAEGSLGQCEDPTAPLVPGATECVALPSDSCTSGSEGNLQSNEESSAPRALAMLSVLLAILALAFY